jgi:serine/threonine-protein kinase
VRGDLDAITAKAMHVDPAQRYASAAEMMSDLERYRDGLPVIARPDTLRYRLAKLAKRKPWLPPVAAIAVLAVAAYIVTLTDYSQRLAREERLAAAAQKFMVDLFRSPDPYAPADAERGRDITVVEALDMGQRRVRSEFEEQPALKASLLVSISEVYGSLDQSRKAIELREEALALERALYGYRSEQAMMSLRALGSGYSAIGARERADALFDEQLALASDLYSVGDPKLGLAEVASGIHASTRGDINDSLRLLESGVEKLRPASAQYAQTLIDALIASAEQYGMEDLEPAFAATEEAERIARDAFGADSLQVALVRIRLASTMTLFKDFAGSEGNFLAALPVLEAKLGADHASTLS